MVLSEFTKPGLAHDTLHLQGLAWVLFVGNVNIPESVWDQRTPWAKGGNVSPKSSHQSCKIYAPIKLCLMWKLWRDDAARCDASHARVACLLDINLFPLKRLTWPCGTCEPMDGERANPGWAHTSLEFILYCIDGKRFVSVLSIVCFTKINFSKEKKGIPSRIPPGYV